MELKEESEYILNKNNGIHYSRWLDNSLITVDLTCFDVFLHLRSDGFLEKERKLSKCSVFILLVNIISLWQALI